MPGPTGESNALRLRGRGVFVAISPWNFPLAIFLGQVTAALMAGNSVVAKPAEQTPLIAAEAVRLLHEAGIPASALHLVPGDGRIGAALVAHPDIAGVVFTGSTEVARSINRTLAAKQGPIVPLIAETGGINAMIVDATALPEQVADDVVTSAFRSAGQRCSALRLLFLQDDVADRMIEMISGAARELAIGDPCDPAVQIGPVIDAEAKRRLEAHIARMKTEARVHFAGRAPDGNFVAPHIFELSDAGELTEEVFGPVLHVVRYPADGLERVLQSIERSGYGLTLGIHSRIDDSIEGVIERLAGRQYLCQPQHDRRGGRRAAVRRPWPVRHRPQGRRPALSAALCHRADRDRQHRGGRRQRGAVVGQRIADLHAARQPCHKPAVASTARHRSNAPEFGRRGSRDSIARNKTNKSHGSDPTMEDGIFEGLKVLDCASFIAAPAAATVLSDFGAEVIKIEPPGIGRPLSQPAEFAGISGQPAQFRVAAGIPQQAAVSRSIWPSRKDRRCCIGWSPRPMSSSPIFRPACAPGSASPMPSWRRSMTRLIYASFTGYGEKGDEADKPGFDSNAYWARSGLMDLVRADTDTTPARSVAGMGDHPCAMALYGAIVTALYKRERTGKGSHVSSNLMANGIWANGVLAQAKLCGAKFGERRPREHALNAVTNHYQCRDGRWIILSLLNEERQWPALARCLGREDFITDAEIRHQARPPRAVAGIDQDLRRDFCRPRTSPNGARYLTAMAWCSAWSAFSTTFPMTGRCSKTRCWCRSRATPC